MNIISSHKMYIISPSVTRAAVRGWFWVSGCSSDMSRCIHWDWYWYPGDCLRSLGQLRHRFATYYGSRISQKSGSVLGSRVFEAPFARLVSIDIRIIQVEMIYRKEYWAFSLTVCMGWCEILFLLEQAFQCTASAFWKVLKPQWGVKSL